jgi:hypothetical protein
VSAINLRRLLLTLCLAAVATGTVPPLEAQAFVCARAATDANNIATGPSLAWPTRQVPFSLTNARTSQIDKSLSDSTLSQAFAVWQLLQLAPSMVAQCGALPGTDLTFVPTAAPASVTWVGYNFLDPGHNYNVVLFRDTAWKNAANAGDIIALTTTTYSAKSGEILDADIEFNSADFHFVTANPGDTDTDLLNTAVHEIGHFVGLAHCGLVSCGHGEVMEPTADHGETLKRLLKCDDRAGMVFKYPAGQPNGFCNGAVNAACGLCAAPQPLGLIPRVTLTRSDPGRGAPSCATGAEPSAWSLLLLAAVARRRLQRRASLRLQRWTWGLTQLASLRRCTRAVAIFTCLAGLSACSSIECDGRSDMPSAQQPLIAAMRLQGQVLSDPWRLILATDFLAPAGNLADGHAELFANHSSKPTVSPALRPLLQASGVPADGALQGSFALPLRVSEATGDGATLHLGTQLVDSDGRRSNCYVLDFSFNLFAK